MTGERRSALLRLEWSVRAIAQEPAIQRTLYPAGIPVGEELALELDEHARAAFDHGIALPGTAHARLLALRAHLTAMSALDREELWFDDDVLTTAPEWTEARLLARRVIEAMGWSNAPPPAERDLYVGPEN